MLTGADVLGSLFDDEDACGWNVNALDTPLQHLTDAPGISSSMLYFGSWRAMFAFHTEDFDLYSINYIHTGEAGRGEGGSLALSLACWLCWLHDRLIDLLIG